MNVKKGYTALYAPKAAENLGFLTKKDALETRFSNETGFVGFHPL